MSSNIKKQHSNAAGYDQWASFYDQYPNPTVAMDELAFPSLWKTLTNKDVLEIGCGTGRHSQKLVSAGNRLTGIDVSSGMLAVARKKLEGTPAVFFEADFMTYTALPQNHFNAALASLVVEHIKNLDIFFERVALTLKPKGDFYLSEIHPSRAAQGILAHFKDATTNEEVHLNSYYRSTEEIESAAGRSKFKLMKKQEVLGNDQLVSINAKWEKYVGVPMILIWHFQRP